MENWLDNLQEYSRKKEAVALVTVIKCFGSTPCKIASRMIVTKDKKIFGTIGGGKLEFLAIDEAIKSMQENKIVQSSYTLGPEFEQCCGGKVELMIEPMNQSPEVFIFGAGHIGVEIAHLMKGTPFSVNLIDSREGWLDTLHLEPHVKGHSVNLCDFKTFNDAVNWNQNSYVLVLTHDHSLDFEIIAMALKKETKFLGLIGSKTKRMRFHNMLIKEMGIVEGMSNVVCPIGLEIGGDSPKEIALSVVAQLLKLHYSEAAKI